MKDYNHSSNHTHCRSFIIPGIVLKYGMSTLIQSNEFGEVVALVGLWVVLWMGLPIPTLPLCSFGLGPCPEIFVSVML